MSKAHLTHANEIFHGASFNAGAFAHFERKGVPIHSSYFYSYGTVAAPDPDGYAEAQAVAAAGYLTMNGALGGVADVARGLVVDSSGAGDTTQSVTATGTDMYGNAVVETIALNGTTAVAGLKAFKTVTSLYVDDACDGNVFVGTTDVLGLPFRAATKSRVVDVWFNDAKDASATVVVADTTSPATATTGDVRGTIDPNSACDGAKEVVVVMIPDAANAFGVAQFAG
jgi:hypothetical protein